MWLLERRNIQELDVLDDFCRFLKVVCPCRRRVTTRSAVFATLNREQDAPKFDIPSRAFVEQWITHPQQLRVLKKAYISNATALTGMRNAINAGMVTAEIRRRADQDFVRGLMPKATPTGLAVGPPLTDEYLEQVDLARIPSLAIEIAISDHEWQAEGGADRNTLIDKFHLISALPYVDEIISNDNFFQKIFPAAARTGHVRAILLSNNQFLSRF